MFKYPKDWKPRRFYFVFGSDPLYEYRTLGWHRFHCGLFWLHTDPPNGAQITRKFYYGFWLRIRYWLPFEIER